MPSRSYTIPSRAAIAGKAKQSPQYKGVAYSEVNTPGAPSSSQTPKKRKLETVDLTKEEDEVPTAANAVLAGINPPKRRSKKKGEAEEKRLRVFRKKAPISYIERLDRVRTQRMFLINRNRSISADDTHEEEVFDIAGTTGNIYQVTISKEPKCTCPDAANGNQCKHIVYVLVNVLKAPENLSYQLAFLTSELAIIFANVPITPQSSSNSAPTSTDTGGSRKPIEGDCPVCVMAFDASGSCSEDILWCKAACGNNIHKQCFEQWAKSKPGQVKCVYCRTLWKGDEESAKRINKTGVRNEEGYVNVAGELGLSGERDVSSYHQVWTRQQYGRGYGGISGYDSY